MKTLAQVGFEPTQSMTHLSMSVTITLHVWRLRPLGHRAMWSGWIVLSLNFHLGQCFHKRVPFELWYTSGDQIRVYGWYDVPIEGHINIGWMSWESLRQFRASSLSSPFCPWSLPWISMLIMMKQGHVNLQVYWPPPLREDGSLKGKYHVFFYPDILKYS